MGHKGSDEGNHALQDYKDLYPKKIGSSSGKYLKNENSEMLLYEDRRQEQEAKQKTINILNAF